MAEPDSIDVTTPIDSTHAPDGEPTAEPTADSTADSTAEPTPGSILDDWVQAVCDQFEIDPEVVDVAAVLDLAKDAAHGVARPAAPLTTFLAGYLAGRSGPGLEADPAAVTRKVLADLAALVPAPTDLDHPEGAGRHAG